MRKFAIELFELYEKDYDGTNIGHTIRYLTYIQKKGRQDTIKNLKDWIFEKGLENNDDLCPCFIYIQKYSYYDNKKNVDILETCEYQDDTFLNYTEFNENNVMYISFDKSRNCTCGKIRSAKAVSNALTKRFEKEKKNIQDDCDRKIEKNNKIHEDKLNKVTNEFKDKIQQQKQENRELRMEMNKKNNEYEEKIKKMEKINEEKNRKNEDKIKALDKSISEYDLKEKTFMKNKISAENEYNKLSPEVYEKYYEEEKDKLVQEILKEMSYFLINVLSFEDLVNEIIPKIAEKEKFSKCIKDLIEEKINSIKDENLDFKVSHFNILIMGNTGVGKSTLLNKILKDDLAKTDFGKACTQGKPQEYESKNVKGIRIWDTKGIEPGTYNINAAHFDIEEAIDNLVKENNPDKFIHCIWYCVCSNRFVKEEIDNLKKCYNLYIKKLPIIVIFTQSDNQEKADRMINYIKQEITPKKDEEEINIKIVKVLAEDMKNDNGIIKAFGISNLMKETCESTKQGIESSCVESLMKQGEKILMEEFKENINDLKNNIFNEEMNLPDLDDKDDKEQFNIINEIIEKDEDSIALFENFDFHGFTKFVSQFSKRLAESLLHKNKLNKTNLIDILNIMATKCNDIKNYFDEIFEKKLNNISNQLADRFDALTHELDSSYNICYLSSKFSHNQLKLQSKNNIINNLKPYIENQIYREISKKLYDLYAENFSNKLIEIFNYLLSGESETKIIEDIFWDKGQEIAEKTHKKIVSLLDYPEDNYVNKKPKGKSMNERLNQRKKKAKDNNKEKKEEEEDDDEDEDDDENKKNDK